MISDLQAMTETDLKKLTAAQLVDHVLQERITSTVTVQEGDRRGMTRYVVEHRDYRGKLTGSETTLTTYKPDGSVDVITKVEKDKDGTQTKKTEIHHDGTHAWAVVSGVTPKMQKAPIEKAVEAIVATVKKPSILARVKALFHR